MAFLMFVSLSLAILVATLGRAGTTEALHGSVNLNLPTSASHFEYVGCLGSDTFSADGDVATFTQVEEWEFMNVNQCISDCHHAMYAALNNQCVCRWWEVNQDY